MAASILKGIAPSVEDIPYTLSDDKKIKRVL